MVVKTDFSDRLADDAKPMVVATNGAFKVETPTHLGFTFAFRELFHFSYKVCLRIKNHVIRAGLLGKLSFSFGATVPMTRAPSILAI